MMQFPIDICGVKLKNQTAAIQYMRSMIKQYKFGELLRHSDFLFVKTLLYFHDQYQEKAGCGVDTIFVANSEFNKKALFIRRTDGSVIDFSWQNIIKSKRPHADIFFALREAVYPQIKEFKENLFQNNQCVKCALSKQKLDWETTHIDHQYPLTFSKLVERWLALNQYHASDIKIIDCGETKEIKDKKQKACWYKFHQKFARLRALHLTVNLSLGNRKTGDSHE